MSIRAWVFRSVAGAVAVGLLVGCGSKPTLTSFMKGTWNCTTDADSGIKAIVVNVDDHTFTVDVTVNDGGSSGDEKASMTGTWDSSFGQLSISGTRTLSSETGGDPRKFQGLLGEFAATSSPTGKFDTTWAFGDAGGSSGHGQPLEVAIDGSKVRFIFTSDEQKETTICTKR